MLIYMMITFYPTQYAGRSLPATVGEYSKDDKKYDNNVYLRLNTYAY